MGLVVDPRYSKLDAAILMAKNEVANFQATIGKTTPADIHHLNALEQITTALSLMEVLLKELRDRKS